MLLVIEDKDDPAGQIAAELDDTSETELAYIPVISIQLECNEQQAKIKCEVDRLSYECRKKQAEEISSPPSSEKLLPLFLRTACNLGERPAYLSPSAASKFEGDSQNRMKLYTQG